MADRFLFGKFLALAGATLSGFCAENVSLTEVPDYSWHAGCFGTASGNLMGYWDRHGLPNVYTGPTAGSVAPLNSFGQNRGIRSLWASHGGFDGRPADQPGHIDDYWQVFVLNQVGEPIATSFEDTSTDPFQEAGRAEHEPDCLGDFMGQSQRKYSDLNGECDGNIDGFAFNFWEESGARMTNFVPPMGTDGIAVRDIQSGLREFSRCRGYEAEVVSQLADFNSTIPAGTGFTFEDLKTEIDAGYPVLLILQHPTDYSRSLPGMPRANPNVHAMVAFGYVVTDGGMQAVKYMTSWGSSDRTMAVWDAQTWEAFLPLRGVILYHPQPRITKVERANGQVRVQWDGPSSVLLDEMDGATKSVHAYVVERADSLEGEFVEVTTSGTELNAAFADAGGEQAFFRVRLVKAE